MSLSLYWRPSAPRNRHSLPDALKFILRERFGNGSSIPHGLVIGQNEMSYLEGLRDAKVEGAQELLDAIRQYADVELWTE